MAGMHVGVDEARRDQLAARVDVTVDLAREALADEEDGVVLKDQLRIAPERVMSVGVADQPPAANARAH